MGASAQIQYPENTKIATAEMFRERLLLAMAQGHALASQTSGSLSDLSEQPYLDRLHCEFRIPHARDHPSGRACDYHDPAAQIRTRGFDPTGRGGGRRHLPATFGNRGRTDVTPGRNAKLIAHNRIPIDFNRERQRPCGSFAC
jgi:hypothetical protein